MHLFSSGQHSAATDVLVVHIMLASPGANCRKMLAGRKFDDRGELVSWDLCHRKISKLPEMFGALVCNGFLGLGSNQLQSLPESFGNISVAGPLLLSRNQLQRLPKSFSNITVGGDLTLHGNQLMLLPQGFETITVGGNLGLQSNKLKGQVPSEFPNVKGDVHTDRGAVKTGPNATTVFSPICTVNSTGHI